MLKRQSRFKHTIFVASPSINTTSESVMTSGDLVRYTARTNRNKACAWMSLLEDSKAMFSRLLGIYHNEGVGGPKRVRKEEE